MVWALYLSALIFLFFFYTSSHKCTLLRTYVQLQDVHHSFVFNLLVPSCAQNVEAKEKESAALPVKKGAKGKSVKVKQETLPTPQGRRVVPRVTSTMKAEANRKADIKKGEGKRGRKVKVCVFKFK